MPLQARAFALGPKRTAGAAGTFQATLACRSRRGSGPLPLPALALPPKEAPGCRPARALCLCGPHRCRVAARDRSPFRLLRVASHAVGVLKLRHGEPHGNLVSSESQSSARSGSSAAPVASLCGTSAAEAPARVRSRALRLRLRTLKTGAARAPGRPTAVPQAAPPSHSRGTGWGTRRGGPGNWLTASAAMNRPPIPNPFP